MTADASSMIGRFFKERPRLQEIDGADLESAPPAEWAPKTFRISKSPSWKIDADRIRASFEIRKLAE
jgi:hypothetical protein